MLVDTPAALPSPHGYTTFTAQELSYLAHGARALAHLASEDAKRQENPGIRESFANEERVHREFAAKCERLEREAEALGALDLPVLRMPPQSLAERGAALRHGERGATWLNLAISDSK